MHERLTPQVLFASHGKQQIFVAAFRREGARRSPR
jgi:hypothetical protein